MAFWRKKPKEETATPPSSGNDQKSAEKKSMWSEASDFMKNTVGMVESKHNDLKGLDPDEKWEAVKGKKTGPPYKHCDDYAWANNVVKYSNIQFLLSIVMAALVWFFVWGAFHRPVYMAKASDGIENVLNNYRDTELGDLSETFAWLFDLLQNMNLWSMEPKAQYRSYLAQMSPDIYEGWLNSYNKALPDIKAGQLFISLHITNVIKVYMNPEDKRMTIYVRGFMVRAARKTGVKSTTGRIMNPLVIYPYRAEVIVRRDFPSKLNPTGLYIEKLTQKFGDEAISWINSLGIDTKGPLVVEPPKQENTEPK